MQEDISKGFQIDSMSNENLKNILEACEKSDAFIFAAGTGFLMNRKIAKVQAELMKALSKYKEKLYCLGDEEKTLFFHGRSVDKQYLPTATRCFAKRRGFCSEENIKMCKKYT